MKREMNADVSNIYQLEGRVPVMKAIPFGLQHILAMLYPNLTPITIIAAAGDWLRRKLQFFCRTPCLWRASPP